jgi:hypothetical protein
MLRKHIAPSLWSPRNGLALSSASLKTGFLLSTLAIHLVYALPVVFMAWWMTQALIFCERQVSARCASGLTTIYLFASVANISILTIYIVAPATLALWLMGGSS